MERLKDAFILALTQEVEQLREDVRELGEAKVRYVWFAGPESGKLTLYTGEKLGLGEVLSTMTWCYKSLELEIGYSKAWAPTHECTKFVEDLGISNAQAYHVVLRLMDKTIVCGYSCRSGFRIGSNVGVIRYRYYVSTKTGFEIMRKIMKDCDRYGCKVPIILLDEHGQRIPFFIGDFEKVKSPGPYSGMSDPYEAMLKHFEEKISAFVKRTVHVRYSAYETNENDVPIDNLHKTAVKGKVMFYQKHNPFYGEGKDYVSKEIRNPTWLEVAKLANDMIRTTGDKTHVFLEGVQKDGSIAYFQMGS
jgi:hypothetical protein